MYIIRPHIFNQFPELVFGFSTKIGVNSIPPYYFNLSFSVGDDKTKVTLNRDLFFNALGIPVSKIAFQRQIHSDIIKIVDQPGDIGECDAMITSRPGLGLTVTAADCVPIFLFDKKNKIIAGVHSGWRGTENKILLKVLEIFKTHFNSNPVDIFAYLGPSISQINYQVGSDFQNKFDPKYLTTINSKMYLDVAQINYDFLTSIGIPEVQIQRSYLCTFEQEKLLHSYRRDKERSGRSVGLIALKENIE